MPASLIAPVVDAARAAGRAILEARASSSMEVRQKPDGPVTSADLAADALLASRLGALVPEAAWLSEETADAPARLKSARVWVVDPLDGTQEFLRGTAHFGVSVALVEHGQPVLGVLHFPVGGETLYASAGGGAFALEGDGRPRQLTLTPQERALMVTVRQGEVRKAWTVALAERLGARLAPVGSTVRKLARVALGECDAYVSPYFSPCEWDVCAGDLILREAGGVLTNLQGERLTYNRRDIRVTHGMIACRADLLGPIRAALHHIGHVS